MLDRIGIHLGEVVIHEDDSGVKDLYGIQVDILRPSHLIFTFRNRD